MKSFKTLCFLYENFQYHFGLHLNWSFEAPRRPVLYHICAFFFEEREEKYFVKKNRELREADKIFWAIVNFSLFVDVLAISCWCGEVKRRKRDRNLRNLILLKILPTENSSQ